ncbi:globin [Mactra antiquata]
MFEVMSASFEGDFKRTDKESQISDVQRTHGIKMMKGINNIVINLDNAGQLRDNIRLLASDHIDKGITAHDIKMGLEILQGLIHESLGEMYDVMTAEAWRQCSNIICTILDAEMVSSSSA